jgi:adenine-specific DNA-methyltransferase
LGTIRIRKLTNNKVLKEAEIKGFPTTRYQGSKRKILPWIYRNTRKLEFNTVLDAFGGTGSVSYLFKKMNKEVTYNDKLAFNYQLGKALIENNDVYLSEQDIQYLLSNIQVNNINVFIQKTFKGVYYTDEENIWLDQVLNNLHNMNTYPNEILELKKSMAYYAIFQSCIAKRPYNLFHRKNLYMRLNDVERNFGNKTTWDKSFELHFEKFIKEMNDNVFSNGLNCRATNRSVFDIENVDYDLVYLDPPYIAKSGKNESSDYLKCYHFLEGMVNYDLWQDRIDYDTKNLCFKDHSQLNDFKKATIHESLELLIEKFQNSIIVLSYKQGGTPSIDEIKKIMKKFKTRVYTRSMHYKYALNKQNGDAKKNREVLIIGI